MDRPEAQPKVLSDTPMESTRPRAPCTQEAVQAWPLMMHARCRGSGRLCRWSPQVFFWVAGADGLTRPPRPREVWERRYADDACRRAAREECGHRLRMCFSFTFTRTTHIPICVHGCGHIYAGACSLIRGALVKGQSTSWSCPPTLLSCSCLRENLHAIASAQGYRTAHS